MKEGDMMKKITVFLVLLVIVSTILIAGCTQVQTLPAPAPTPGVTAVQTYVENQQGVAIIRTVVVTPTPTPAPTIAVNPSFEVDISKTVVIKTNETTNKT